MTESKPSIDPQWSTLMAQSQAGNATSYKRLLTEITPYVRHLARRYAWNADDLEDVVQDVLLTVHRVRQTYDPALPIKPWLASITNRRSIDAVRRRSRVTAHETENAFAYETFADESANKSFDADDAARQLPPLLAELTPRQREALELVKLQEMSLAQASAHSGQSIASLKVNVHRAIKLLQKKLPKADKTTDHDT